MWYLGTVWLEGCSSSSLLPPLTSSPILPCNRSECTNLQQLLVALWFGLWLFQEDPKTWEGETLKRHCSCCWQLPSCVITAMWVVFYLYFVLYQWLAAKCGLKQKQILLTLYLHKHHSWLSLGSIAFSRAGHQGLLILKLLVASEVFFFFLLRLVFRVLYSWCRKCSDYTYRFFTKGRKVGVQNVKIPENATIWSIC